MLTERTNDSTLALNTALTRLSCYYSLGYRDDGRHGGRRAAVAVQLRPKGLQAFYPEAYLLRTASMKRESNLLAAFVDPERADGGLLRALLIPRGGNGTTWTAAVQLRLRPSAAADNRNELGASIVRHDAVTDQFAWSVATSNTSRDIVFEKSLDIRPGDFSIVAVASDVKTGQIGSRRIEHHWPDPATADAAITPIAVLQTGPAAISRDGTPELKGPLARDRDEVLDPSGDISLQSVVCRGVKTKGPVRIERWLEGGTRARFEPITLAEPAELCHPITDVVPAGRLAHGDVDYRVVARIGDDIVAQERRTLRVGASAP